MNQLRTWAEAVLQRPIYAAGFALVCTIIPFMEWLAWSWLVLVQLRYGMRYSVPVLIAISAGVLIVIGLFNGLWEVAAVHIGLLVVPLWIFSWILHATVSLNFTIQAVAAIVFTLFLLAGFIGAHDAAAVTEFFKCRLAQVMPLDSALEQSVDDFTQFFVIYWPAALFWSYLFSLFLGRWWQAALDNPGGFKREFHALRVNYFVGGCALVLILLSFWAPDNVVLVAASILAASLLTIAGLGFVHFVAQFKQWHVGVLIGIYVGIFFLSPIVVPLLIILAAIDSAADLRKRLS